MICDAHNHVHYPCLDPWRETVLREAIAAGVSAMTVNGTREDDWEAVAALTVSGLRIHRAFGVHPWQVAHRSPDWKRHLGRRLTDSPGSSVGEVGLDAMVVEQASMEEQTRVFLTQWEMAVERGVPVTVHCVRAWEPLRLALRQAPVPSAGFLLHAWNGPEAMIPFFAGKGAYFSFSPYFLHARKQAIRESFRQMPRDRILLETDAPDLAPPLEQNPHPLTDSGSGGKVWNHPANLRVALTGLAGTLGLSETETAALTSENWERIFGPGATACPP